MARIGLFVLLGAGLLLGTHFFLHAADSKDEGEGKLQTQLAVQKALQEGRDHLQRGNYQAAVFALESQVARINGSREYLSALAEAYRGYIRELKQTNRASEVPTYLERLKILDPGVVLDVGAAPPAPPVTAKAPAELPAPKPVAPPERKAPALAALAGGQPEKKARGKGEDSGNDPDPFAEDNQAPPSPSRAKEVLAKAEQEFGKDNFLAAGRLYEQACQEDERLTAECGQRWAYCRFWAVAEALNNGPPESVRGLEREVQQALTLARSNAKLEKFGNDLQRRLEQAGRGAGQRVEAAAPVEVKHTPRGERQKWAVAETANFRVLHNQPAEAAERVARAAESARLAASRKWFNDNGIAWNPVCEVYVYASRQEYLQETRAPMDSPGHTDIGSEGGRVVWRKIHLSGDEKGMLTQVLPHEVAHAVLAGRFDGRPVPRWADEGMAVLCEPRERVERHLTSLPNFRRDGQLFSVRELLTLDHWPQPNRIGAFYAQSVSLVDYLSRLKSPDVVTRFMRDAMKSGYEPALERHYGIRDLRELEQNWQQFAFGGGAANPTVAGKIR
jgi:hypothetical protein